MAVILVDLGDLFLKNFLDLGGVRDYQSFDKSLDQVYLFLFLVAALRFPRPARNIALALYAFRLAGLTAFEVTGERATLLLFPNVFDFWFLFVASLPHWRPAFAWAPAPTALALALLSALKLFQEYALHYGRWLDSFTTKDVLRSVADALTAPFG